MEKYKVFMSGWLKTTVYVEAENEDEALDNAQMEMSFDNLEENIEKIPQTKNLSYQLKSLE